jgi:addiction module HigA family antidote
MPLEIPANRRPITPGEVLREDFLQELNITQGELASALGVDRTSVNELLNGRRRVTSDMALRLGHAFSNSPQYWLNLQLALDLYHAARSPVREEIEHLRVLVRA